MIHEFEGQEAISYLWLGSSHIYRGVDPELMDKFLGCNTFNGGSSSQRPEDSYYLLKYFLSRKSIDTVVYDISYLMFQNYDGDAPIRSHILMDYMKTGKEKISYAVNVRGSFIWACTEISNIIRYKETWKQPEKIKGNLKLHFTDKDYKRYWYDPSGKNAEEFYRSKGFVYSNSEMTHDRYLQVPWSELDLYPNQVEYLNKMIELCANKDVELIFISVPVYPTYIERAENYKDVNQFFYNIASKNGIPYYDFNLVPLEKMQLQAADFQNATHLNGKGAGKFSEFLATILIQEREKTQ